MSRTQYSKPKQRTKLLGFDILTSSTTFADIADIGVEVETNGVNDAKPHPYSRYRNEDRESKSDLFRDNNIFKIDFSRRSDTLHPKSRSMCFSFFFLMLTLILHFDNLRNSSIGKPEIFKQLESSKRIRVELTAASFINSGRSGLSSQAEGVTKTL